MTTRWLVWVAVVAAVVVTLLISLFVAGYGLGSGRIDPSIAGPAATWVGDGLTAIGFGGIMLQLFQIRRAEEQDVAREENALFAWAEWQPWELDGRGAGDLVRIFVRNDGTRKVMDLDVALLPAKDAELPSDADRWKIVALSDLAVPPGRDAATPVAVFHVPHESRSMVFGAHQQPPRISVTWTDARNQRLRMDGNQPTETLARR